MLAAVQRLAASAIHRAEGDRFLYLWGTRGSGTEIGVGEMNPKRKHRLGAVAAAHPGDPRRADSQIYVTLAPAPDLDGKYTVFAQVISGMDVVRKLQVGDVIIGANGHKVATVPDLESQIESSRRSIALLVNRQGTNIFIPVRIGN